MHKKRNMKSSKDLTERITSDIAALLESYTAQDQQHAQAVEEFKTACENERKKLKEDSDTILSQAQIKADAILASAKQNVVSMNKEIEAWKEEKEAIAKTQSFMPAIKIDVGGCLFTTSSTTLTRFPETMIGAMFSGRHELNKHEDGTVFIDRDGTHFRHILNFLRNPEAFVMTLSGTPLDELKAEVRFYGLEDFMFPFKPAADVQVYDTQGQHVLVSQDEQGIWYGACIDYAPSPKAPIIVCKKCSFGCAVNSTYPQYGMMSNFVEKREIRPEQPAPTSVSRCRACRKF